MTLSFESFRIDGQPVGAIVRDSTRSLLATLTCFALPGGALVHTESVIEFDQRVFAWTSYSYMEAGPGSEITVAREPRHGQECVPGYAEWLLVQELLQSKKESVSFRVLEDGDQGGMPLPADLRITWGREVLHNEGAAVVADGRVTLRVQGGIRNTHWFRGSSLVGSDWNGARSYPVPTLDDALVGVRAEVATVLRAGL